MKKLLSLLILVSVLSFASHTQAAQTTKQQTHHITRTINNITYSTHDRLFYAYTNKDANGGQWVIVIEEKGKLKQIKKKYLNHTITIYYTGDEQTDEEIDILKTVIH